MLDWGQRCWLHFFWQFVLVSASFRVFFLSSHFLRLRNSTQLVTLIWSKSARQLSRRATLLIHGTVLMNWCCWLLSFIDLKSCCTLDSAPDSFASCFGFISVENTFQFPDKPAFHPSRQRERKILYKLLGRVRWCMVMVMLLNNLPLKALPWERVHAQHTASAKCTTRQNHL